MDADPPNASRTAAMPIRASILRIVNALRFRLAAQVHPPVVTELEFLQITGNYAQFGARLTALGHASVATEIRRNALHVGLSWFRLAQEHLQDAIAAVPTNRPRMIFSRAYYAAYSASKSVRYLVNGVVSLKGDDHHKASDLPDDFPSVDKWSQEIPRLYEHRLLADYDNWIDTASGFTLQPQDAVNLARDFVESSRQYLRSKIGVNI